MTTPAMNVEVHRSDRPLTEVIIGSAGDCDIQVVGDPYVSAHHARISRGFVRNPENGVPGSSQLRDLGSTNGTWVQRRGRRLRCDPSIFTTLMPGDVIWVGRTPMPWTGEVDYL